MNICWVTDGNESELLSGAESQFTIQVIRIDETPPLDFDLFIINANPVFNHRTERLGLKFLQKARRNFGIRTPAIVYSFEAHETLLAEFKILNTKGVFFLRLPFSAEEIADFIRNLPKVPLTGRELSEIVLEYCGVRQEWEKAVHDLNYAIQEFASNFERARRIADDLWATIESFAPSQRENLKILQQLLALKPTEVDSELLVNAYRKLKIGLELMAQPDVENIQRKPNPIEHERTPPLFHGKVLIANDEPNLLLPNLLRTKYGYDVLKQATNRTEAERLLLSEKPEVVIADYYFKTAEDGMRFIKFAGDKKHKWVQMVLVNSFRDLSHISFPEGVINCSGEEAQNPEFIHSQIWKAAREDAPNIEKEERADLQLGVSSIEDECRRLLSASIIPTLDFGITRWRRFLMSALKSSLSLLRNLTPDERTLEEIALIAKLMETLKPFETDSEFSYNAVKNIVGMVGVLHKKIDELPESYASDTLHLIGHTFLSYSLGEIESAVEELNIVIDKLKKTAVYEDAIKKIRVSCERFKNETFSFSDAVTLLRSAEETLKLLPEITKEISTSSQPTKKRVRLIIVEDDEIERDKFIVPVVKEVKSEIKQLGCEIAYETYDNAADALSAVPLLDKSHRIKPVEEGDHASTLAIVDLYLPRNNRHVKPETGTSNKRKISSAPRKQNGLNLIRDLRNPNRNVNVIVLSTSGSDKDRRDIQRSGVSKKDHIIKSSDKKNKARELADAITRNITKSQSHTIEQVEERDGTKFRIDSFYVKFDNAETEILKAILQLSVEQPYFAASDILSLIPNTVAEASIKKSVSSIRKKIQKSLDLQGCSLEKEDVIATVPNFDGRKSAYKLWAEIKTEESIATQLKPCRLLVIENDADVLNYISSSLSTIAGVVIEQATNVQDAIKTARSFRPDIISLDLDLPRTRKDFKADPNAGDRNAGLDALERIRLDFSNVKAILTSTYFNDRMLRDRAVQLGISNENVVAKFESSGWLNLLIQRVKQLRDEVTLGKKADVSPDVPEPIIEILQGCNIGAGILKLRINGNLYKPKQSQQAKIIGLLLKNANKTLTYEKIRKHLNLAKISGNNRKTWTSRIRKDIRRLWLRLPESDFLDAEDKILENLPEGITLHAHILNPENLK